MIRPMIFAGDLVGREPPLREVQASLRDPVDAALRHRCQSSRETRRSNSAGTSAAVAAVAVPSLRSLLCRYSQRQPHLLI